MGPHTFNFAQAAEWAEGQGAARRVSDMAAAVAAARSLVADSVARGAMQHAAQQFAAAHRGAAERTAQAVAMCWDSAQRRHPPHGLQSTFAQERK
jgi:3-deoxy-D-manno-octulosonic-acid transferase